MKNKNQFPFRNLFLYFLKAYSSLYIPFRSLFYLISQVKSIKISISLQVTDMESVFSFTWHDTFQSEKRWGKTKICQYSSWWFLEQDCWRHGRVKRKKVVWFILNKIVYWVGYLGWRKGYSPWQFLIWNLDPFRLSLLFYVYD